VCGWWLLLNWMEEQSRESSEAERRRRQLDGEAWWRYGMRDERFTPYGGTGGLWWRLTKNFSQHVIWHDGLILDHCVAKTDDDDVKSDMSWFHHCCCHSGHRIDSLADGVHELRIIILYQSSSSVYNIEYYAGKTCLMLTIVRK
jgi:hypothetical protein